MPVITRDEIKAFLNKDWNLTWDGILDNIIAQVETYFQDWLNWKWNTSITGERVLFKNYVARTENPIGVLRTIKDEAGTIYDLATFLYNGFLIYDKDLRFANDILIVDYDSIAMPQSIRQELVVLIASLFDRRYQTTYDKDVKVIDTGGVRVNERYNDLFEETKKRLRIYKKWLF